MPILTLIDQEVRALVQSATGSPLPAERSPAFLKALDELEAHTPVLYARVIASFAPPGPVSARPPPGGLERLAGVWQRPVLAGQAVLDARRVSVAALLCGAALGLPALGVLGRGLPEQGFLGLGFPALGGRPSPAQPAAPPVSVPAAGFVPSASPALLRPSPNAQTPRIVRTPVPTVEVIAGRRLTAPVPTVTVRTATTVTTAAATSAAPVPAATVRAATISTATVSTATAPVTAPAARPAPSSRPADGPVVRLERVPAPAQAVRVTVPLAAPARTTPARPPQPTLVARSLPLPPQPLNTAPLPRPVAAAKTAPAQPTPQPTPAARATSATPAVQESPAPLVVYEGATAPGTALTAAPTTALKSGSAGSLASTGGSLLVPLEGGLSSYTSGTSP